MKKIILSNWRFKLISLLVGFVIWILLVNISNPEVVRTKTVPLTVLNESVLTRAGKTYTLPNSDSVTVSYQVRTRDAYKIQAEDFRATVDLENLYDITGAVPVMVEVVGNRDLIGGMPTARPGVIRVDTENVQNKVFSLDTHEEGEPASGYEVGAVTLSSRSHSSIFTSASFIFLLHNSISSVWNSISLLSVSYSRLFFTSSSCRL